MRCRTPGLHLLGARSILPTPVVTAKYIPRHCQMSPAGKTTHFSERRHFPRFWCSLHNSWHGVCSSRLSRVYFVCPSESCFLISDPCLTHPLGCPARFQRVCALPPSVPHPSLCHLLFFSCGFFPRGVLSSFFHCSTLVFTALARRVAEAFYGSCFQSASDACIAPPSA